MKTYCFFSAHFPPYLGGVERYTHNIARFLQKSGNRVIVVTSEMEGEPDLKVEQGIEIIRMKSFHLMKDRLPIVKWNKKNRKVFQYLKESKIDYMIFNTKFYPLILWGTFFAKKSQIPSIVIEHGTGHLEFGNSLISKVGELYEHGMARFIYWNCRNFVGVSQECNIWLEHFHIKAKGVLYNAIDYEAIQKMYKDQPYSQRNENIVYSGRLLKEKGICKLIEAYIRIKDKYPETRLIVVGDGPIYDEIFKEYGNDNRIVFTGKVDFEEVITILSESQIFCFPTDYPEGLPTCVLEAMACGLYTITSKSGGAKEVITDRKYGVILDENSVDEIEKELVRALEQEELSAQIAKTGNNRVREFFDWSHTTEELIAMMREIEKNEH